MKLITLIIAATFALSAISFAADKKMDKKMKKHTETTESVTTPAADESPTAENAEASKMTRKAKKSKMKHSHMKTEQKMESHDAEGAAPTEGAPAENTPTE